MQPAPTLQELDRKLTAILMALQPLIAHHFLRHPWVSSAVTFPLCNRIGRYARRLSRLFAAFAAGTLPASRAPRRKPEGPPPAVGKPVSPIPRRRGWMLAAMGWHVATQRNWLESLLADPAMAEFLAAAPGARRMLRPLCHMLDIAAPALAGPPKPKQPPTRAAARPAPAQPPEPAPQQPLCPRLRARWPWAPRAEPPAARPAGTVLRRLAGPPLALPL